MRHRTRRAPLRRATVRAGVASVLAGQAGPAAGERGEVGSGRDLVLEPHDSRHLRHDDGDHAQQRGHPQRVDGNRAALAPTHGSSSADTADASSVRPPTCRRTGNGSRDRADTRTVTKPSSLGHPNRRAWWCMPPGDVGRCRGRLAPRDQPSRLASRVDELHLGEPERHDPEEQQPERHAERGQHRHLRGDHAPLASAPRDHLPAESEQGDVLQELEQDSGAQGALDDALQLVEEPAVVEAELEQEGGDAHGAEGADGVLRRRHAALTWVAHGVLSWGARPAAFTPAARWVLRDRGSGPGSSRAGL